MVMVHQKWHIANNISIWGITFRCTNTINIIFHQLHVMLIKHCKCAIQLYAYILVKLSKSLNTMDPNQMCN